MAGTYYGYAERNADSYTDWYEVGKYATDMIDETIKVRQEKKDALQKATRDALKLVADAPAGASVSGRASAIKMSDVISKNILIQKKMMESGDSDPRDFLIYTQNALDSIDLSFNAVKAYQEDYQVTMDGIKSKEYSALTADNIAAVEPYGDYNKVGYVMSPDGNLMMGIEVEKEIDGKKVKTIENVKSVNALNGLIVNKVAHNKLEEQVNNYVKTLGTDIRAIIKKAGFDRQGEVITIEDVTKKKYAFKNAAEGQAYFEFGQAEAEQARSIMGDPTNIASILIDTKIATDKGVAYTTTENATEAANDPSKILRVYNEKTNGYNYTISEEQKKEALKFTLNRMREKYKYEEKANVGSELSRDYGPSSMYGGDKKKAPPVKGQEILVLRGKDSGKVLGISQKLDNLRYEEADGVENVATDIGYNGQTGMLEIKGYQVTGKESQGTEEDKAPPSTDGKEQASGAAIKVKKGKNVTNKVNFLKNDIESAPLLSSFVTKIPNPEDPNGGNFRDINQAKAYYKRQYEAKGGPKELDE